MLGAMIAAPMAFTKATATEEPAKVSTMTISFSNDFAAKMDAQVRGIIAEELKRQARSDGFFAQRTRTNQPKHPLS